MTVIDTNGKIYKCDYITVEDVKRSTGIIMFELKEAGEGGTTIIGRVPAHIIAVIRQV